MMEQRWYPISAGVYPPLEPNILGAAGFSVDVLLQDKRGNIFSGCFQHSTDRGRFARSTSCDKYELYELVAWHPFPEPYGGPDEAAQELEPVPQ
jgi:hypothetical protein